LIIFSREIMKALRSFMLEEDGVTAIEYGLIAALVAVAVVAGATAIGSNINALFSRIANCLSDRSQCSSL
jgi:pilus assembly protein Flp/PilA